MKHIAVLGAGTMGLTIARLFANYRYEVSLYEPIGKQLNAVEAQLSGEGLGICLTDDLLKAVADADLIIECVPEQLTIKRELLLMLSAMMKQDAIVASNTSSFSLQTLAQDLPYRDRFMIAHFFNPAHLIPLVEIVGMPDTPPHLLEELVSLLRQCGKTPVVLNKDIPGFIANRLQAALLREACFLLESGIADAKQIDTVVKEGPGLRWASKGPFEIADLGGLDIWAILTGRLFPELSNSSDTPGTIMEKVANNELGVKSGSGYYEYSSSTQAVEEMGDSLRRLLSARQSEGDDQADNA
ncbi:3-hydroxyacyl-CoA dehydrogenase NAD-binding domain-containing protein [Paenibacillus sp. J5C_2022]|uniref:3-hydroxyacyl-CoA dehydrogenase family protein n=1 Tax=Paenibacillus sp. J5C2022 TaxID=2977129 RepID=UPI0021D2526C|nr:3-hydroxyacyl-CoA dehydrogenase NAD-binding domain-containing protein [Paenibacillus sp. J5C2022]MCU6709175.1 3-hydroxyacyl-CoA dehydrogenase NAD-binding domain-containing protein [Paenibacillus sp. J5C2022]